jgi:glutathione synthase/RimK-type ligase-like ATP-grasp enzyme
MRMKRVVIVSSAEDVHAQSVSFSIERLGIAKSIIVNSADLPARIELSSGFGGQNPTDFALASVQGTITAENLLGVWWRRPEPPAISKTVSEPQVRAFCANESRAAFRGWLLSLGYRVINPLAADIAADNKLFQLSMAEPAGLLVPRTKITNSPAEAKRFIEECPGDVVYKTLTHAGWHIHETRLVSSAHISGLDKLCHAPVIFQECIPAERDIRVTVVDDEIFAVSLVSNLPPGHVDWRLDVGVQIYPHRLPEDVSNSIRKYMKSLGLRYGAIDMRLTERGDYYFLEVNTAGQFLFAEIHGEQPISDALARALCREF